MSFGDPIPGADIYIEQEPQGDPIIPVQTDQYGTALFEAIRISPDTRRIKISCKIKKLPEQRINIEVIVTEK